METGFGPATPRYLLDASRALCQLSYPIKTRVLPRPKHCRELGCKYYAVDPFIRKAGAIRVLPPTWNTDLHIHDLP